MRCRKVASTVCLHPLGGDKHLFSKLIIVIPSSAECQEVIQTFSTVVYSARDWNRVTVLVSKVLIRKYPRLVLAHAVIPSLYYATTVQRTIIVRCTYLGLKTNPIT